MKKKASYSKKIRSAVQAAVDKKARKPAANSAAAGYVGGRPKKKVAKKTTVSKKKPMTVKERLKAASKPTPTKAAKGKKSRGG